MAAAKLLQEKYPDKKLVVIDSLCSSSGYGLLVDAAADLRDSGATLVLTEEAPTEEQKKGMEAFLCKKYGAKSAKIEVRQDKALLGGFILRVGSDEYDWSMKGRLNRLEQRLTWR